MSERLKQAHLAEKKNAPSDRNPDKGGRKVRYCRDPQRPRLWQRCTAHNNDRFSGDYGQKQNDHSRQGNEDHRHAGTCK
jgi:hypothetical protein